MTDIGRKKGGEKYPGELSGGEQHALGYSNLKVAENFWVFGISALIGTVVGFGGAFLLMPEFYALQNEDKMLPEIAIRFHPVIFLYFVILPIVGFSLLAVDIVFKDVEGIPVYQFDFPGMLVSLAVFIILYEILMYASSTKSRDTVRCHFAAFRRHFTAERLTRRLRCPKKSMKYRILRISAVFRQF